MEHITFVPTELAKRVEDLEEANRLLQLENQSLRQRLEQDRPEAVRRNDSTSFER